MQFQPQGFSCLFLDDIGDRRLFVNVLPGQLNNIAETQAGITVENKCTGYLFVEMRRLHQRDIFVASKFSCLFLFLFSFDFTSSPG